MQEFAMGELGMSRSEFLYGVDYAIIIDMWWCWWEKKSGKTAPWNAELLDRIVAILKERHAKDAKNNT